MQNFMIFFHLTKYVMTSSRGEGSEIFFLAHILVGDRLNSTCTKFHVKNICQSKVMRGRVGGNPPLRPPIMKITIKNSPWGIGLIKSDQPSESKKDGVCIYYKEHIPLILLDDINTLNNCLVTETLSQNEKCFLTCIYCSPS